MTETPNPHIIDADTLTGEMRPIRRELQAVFQDPYASLNPRMRAVDIVAEPIRNFERARVADVRERVAALFDKVGLRRDQIRSIRLS